MMPNSRYMQPPHLFRGHKYSCHFGASNNPRKSRNRTTINIRGVFFVPDSRGSHSLFVNSDQPTEPLNEVSTRMTGMVLPATLRHSGQIRLKKSFGVRREQRRKSILCVGQKPCVYPRQKSIVFHVIMVSAYYI